MPTVWIPSLLRSYTQDQESIQVSGSTVLELINALEVRFPGIKARLCQNDQPRPGIAVVIDGQIARAGLTEAVKEDSEVHFIPAIAGGSRPEF